MKRSEVKTQHRWRLEDIFVSVAEWEKELSNINRETVGILRFKGRLNEREALLEVGAEINIMPFVEGRSTTSLIEKMKKS